MNFKKYLISMIVCAVTIFTMIFNMFVPIKTYASISYEQELLNYCSSVGVNQGIPYMPHYFQNFNGWNNCVSGYNKFVTSLNSLNYPNRLYVTYINSNGAVSLNMFFYDYISSYRGVGGYVSFHSYVYCTYNYSINSDGLEVVNFGYNLHPSGNSEFNYTFTSSPTQYYLQISAPNLSIDTSQDSFLFESLGKIRSFGGFLLGSVSDLSDIILNSPYGNFFNGLKDNASRYIKNILNTTDDDDVTNVLTGYVNGNLRNVTLNNGNQLSDNQITYISNTLGNLQDVYNKNVDIQYNTEDNKYYITPSTSYDTYTSEQITDYFNNYIAYNYNNTYNNYTIIDFTTTNSILSLINANIINCHMMLNSINTSINTSFTNSLNNIFANFETDLKGIFDDFIFRLDTTINNSNSSSSSVDLTSVTDILTYINTDINSLAVAFADFDFDVIATGFADIDAHFNALGGVIAGAIGVAWADIKGELEVLINGINFNFGDITIGDSSTSDDDTSNNITIKGLDTFINGLFDDFKISLDDLFSDIHVVVDNDNTTQEPDTPSQEDDFWKEVKYIIVRKIPLYGQMLELMLPTTDTTYESLSNGSYLLENGISTNNLDFSVSYLSDDGQLDFDTVVDEPILDNLFCISSNSNNSTVLLKVLLDTEFYGYHFSSFDIDISYYYNNYRVKLSNVLLTIFRFTSITSFSDNL